MGPAASPCPLTIRLSGTTPRFRVTVQDVPIHGQMIRLGQLLKLAGVIHSGAEVKTVLSSELVRVNGETETRRGRQLHIGDVVRVGEHELHLTAAVG